jgi:hypothetical protein
MKKVVTTVETWCDYPGCADRAMESGEAMQETTTIEFWYYVPGKGRKPNPIRVEVCESHKTQLRDLFLVMQKYDQKEG